MSKRSFSDSFEGDLEGEEALIMEELEKWKNKLNILKKSKERAKVNDLPISFEKVPSHSNNDNVLPSSTNDHASWFEEESDDQNLDNLLENDVEEITIEIEDEQEVEAPSSGPASAGNQTLEKEKIETAPLTPNLDPQVEELLGKEGLVEEKPENNLHPSIANKWSFILLKGLTDDIKEKLLSKYIVPSNCLAMTAPELNSEIRCNLKRDALDRDDKQRNSQRQLSTVLSALGQALTKLLNSSSLSKQDMWNLIEYLSDAGRLIADLHHSKSLHRRWLVLGMGFQQKIKTNVRDVLVNASIDTLLFGKDLNESLEKAKIMERNSLSIIEQSKVQKPNLNSRGPSQPQRNTRNPPQSQKRRDGPQSRQYPVRQTSAPRAPQNFRNARASGGKQDRRDHRHRN